MIESTRWRWFARWLARHARVKIHGAFGRVRVRGVEALAQLKQAGPVLFVSNHTSWWDPMVTMMLAVDTFDFDGYAMMDAKNLREIGFFARAGGFGVELDDPRDGARAIRYAVKLLDRPGRAVWIYPQGSERPAEERPLVFLPGAAAIGRHLPDLPIIPIALDYRFAASERPELRIAVGEPVPSSRDLGQTSLAQASAVEKLLEEIARDVAGEELGFHDLYRVAKPRANAIMRLLTWLVGGPRLAAPERTLSPSSEEEPGEGDETRAVATPHGAPP